MDLFSTVANTSAGGELQAIARSSCSAIRRRRAEICGSATPCFATSSTPTPCAPPARDAIGDPKAAVEPARIVAIFAKAEAPPNGMLRGRRTTMLSDADINYERHARAALGAVIASVTGDAAIFVSGGTEHQCKPGEAPIAAIVRV